MLHKYIYVLLALQLFETEMHSYHAQTEINKLDFAHSNNLDDSDRVLIMVTMSFVPNKNFLLLYYRCLIMILAQKLNIIYLLKSSALHFERIEALAYDKSECIFFKGT